MLGIVQIIKPAIPEFLGLVLVPHEAPVRSRVHMEKNLGPAISLRLWPRSQVELVAQAGK